MFKSRCNSNVKRDVIVPEVAKIIEDLNDDWRVNYSAPDYVVTLDVITVRTIQTVSLHFFNRRLYLDIRKSICFIYPCLSLLANT